MGCIEGTQFDGHGIIFAQAVFKQCTTQNETAIIFLGKMYVSILFKKLRLLEEHPYTKALKRPSNTNADFTSDIRWFKAIAV